MVFLDTNIFVYARDSRDLRKQRIAQELIAELIRGQKGLISTQVLQEFCNVMLKKAEEPMTPQDLDELLTDVLFPMLRQGPSPDFYRRALRFFEQESISFYDALIVQAALDLGCKTLYSEDLQHGRKFGKLTVKNPFIAK
jgi:predicted nucleic acid-binding protein